MRFKIKWGKSGQWLDEISSSEWSRVLYCEIKMKPGDDVAKKSFSGTLFAASADWFPSLRLFIFKLSQMQNAQDRVLNPVFLPGKPQNCLQSLFLLFVGKVTRRWWFVATDESALLSVTRGLLNDFKLDTICCLLKVIYIQELQPTMTLWLLD